MISDKNTLSHISIQPKTRHSLTDFAYVGHPIKKLFEVTSAEEREAFTVFVEGIAVLLKKHGYTPLIPSLLGHNVDVQKKQDIIEIYRNCSKACRICSLFIAIPSNDSTGLGMEYELARSNGIPIIALCHKDKVVTGMINNETAHILTYSSYYDALKLLDDHLTKNIFYSNFSYYSFDQV